MSQRVGRISRNSDTKDGHFYNNLNISKLFLKAICYCNKKSVEQVWRGCTVSYGMYINWKLFLLNLLDSLVFSLYLIKVFDDHCLRKKRYKTERESKSGFYQCPKFYDNTGQLSVEMKVNAI